MTKPSSVNELLNSFCGDNLHKWKELKGEKLDHALKNLPARLLDAQKYGDALEILTDLEFLEEKLKRGRPEELTAVLESAFERIPDEFGAKKFLFLIAGVLKRDGYFLKENPGSFFQCAWNLCWWHDNPLSEKFYTAPASGWNEHNAPWRAPGEKIFELMERWRKTFESLGGAAWLKAVTPPKEPLASFKGVAERPAGGDFSFIRPDTGDLVVWSSNGEIQILDINSLKELFRFSEDKIIDDDFDFSLDFKVLGYIKKDRMEKMIRIFLWSEDTGLRIYRHPCAAAAICPETRMLYYSDDNKLFSLDLATRKEEYLFEVRGRGEKHDISKIICVAVDRESNMVITATEDNALIVFDLAMHEMKRFDEIFSCALTAIITVPSLKCFITLHDENTFYLWSMMLGKIVLKFRGHEKFVNCVAFDESSGRLFSGSGDGTIREWNIQNGEEICRRLDSDHKINNLVFSPKHSKLIAFSDDFFIRSWPCDSYNSVILPRMKRRKKIQRFYDLSANGRYATVHSDNTIVFYDAVDGLELREISWPHETDITDIIPAGPERLIITDRNRSKTLSASLLDISDYSVAFRRELDFKYSASLFAHEVNKFFMTAGGRLIIFDAIKNEINELDLFKSADDRKGPELEFLPVKPDGNNNSLIFAGGLSSVPQGCYPFSDTSSGRKRGGKYYQKIFIIDAARDSIIFEYSLPDHIIGVPERIGVRNALSFYNVKKPAVNWNSMNSRDRSLQARYGEYDYDHFKQTFMNAEKESEVNFLRLDGLELEKARFTCLSDPAFTSHNGIIAVFECAGSAARETLSGRASEVLVFDAKKPGAPARLSLCAPPAFYDHRNAGILIFGFDRKEIAILELDSLKLSTVGGFKYDIIGVLYIGGMNYILTDSNGDKFFLDAAAARVIDEMDHLAGFKHIIIEKGENELELLTCKNDGFYRMKIDAGMTERARAEFVERKNLKDMTYGSGACCCVHDEHMLSVIACGSNESRAARLIMSFFGASKSKDVDLLKILYRQVDKSEVGGIEKAFSLISTDGRYFLYFVNYRPAGTEPSWGYVGLQAFLIYDLIDDSSEVSKGFKLSESIQRLVWPVHFSDKYIYFRSQSKDGYSSGPIERLDVETRSQNALDDRSSFLDDGFAAAAVSNNIAYAAMIDRHGKLKIISFRERDGNDWYLLDYKINQEHSFPIDSVYFTSNGEFLITRSIDNKIVKWKTGSWTKVETLCPALPAFTRIPENHLEFYNSKGYERFLHVTAADGGKVFFNQFNISGDGTLRMVHRPDGGAKIVMVNNEQLRIYSLVESELTFFISSNAIIIPSSLLNSSGSS